MALLNKLFTLQGCLWGIVWTPPVAFHLSYSLLGVDQLGGSIAGYFWMKSSTANTLSMPLAMYLSSRYWRWSRESTLGIFFWIFSLLSTNLWPKIAELPKCSLWSGEWLFTWPRFRWRAVRISRQDDASCCFFLSFFQAKNGKISWSKKISEQVKPKLFLNHCRRKEVTSAHAQFCYHFCLRPFLYLTYFSIAMGSFL